MDKPSYYAIIPASVRYDTTLCPNAKLLYGEITALCNKEGKCWAGNAYFANLYGVSKVSISKWVRQLVDAGCIESEIQHAEGSKEILNRYITLVNDLTKQKLTDNSNININNTNITFNNNDHFDAFWSAYPVKKGKLAARKAWDKLTLSDDVVKLIAENMKARMDAGEWEDKQYIPHPATFLNGRRWEDEVTPAKKLIGVKMKRSGVVSGGSIRNQNIEDKLTDRSWATGG